MLVAQISLPILAGVFIAGLVIGALLLRVFSPKVAQTNRVKHQLTEKELELSQVKEDVNQHFLRTAEGLASLSKQLYALQTQLTQDAQSLANEQEVTKKLGVLPNATPSAQPKKTSYTASLSPEELTPPKDYAASSKGGTLNENFAHPNFEQPKDYAPNSTGGTLAEDFGLRNEDIKEAKTKKKKKKKKPNQEAEAKN